MKYLTLAAAALGLTLAMPAHAADPKPARTPDAAPTASNAGETKAPARVTRYCVMMEPATGSRIWEKRCQTRDAWLKRGFDPLAPR